MERPTTIKLTQCPTCSHEYHGKFCNNCGEKTFHAADFSIKKFLLHTVDMFTHLDGKLFNSFKYIFTRPGFLTQQNIRGARVKYAKPIQLFLLANVLVFFILHFAQTTDYTPGLGDQIYGNISGYPIFQWLRPLDLFITNAITSMADAKVVASHMKVEDFADHFLINSRIYSKTFLILLVPLYSLVLFAFNFRNFKYFSQALIFAAHFLVYQLITYAIWSLLFVRFNISLFKPIRYVMFETPLKPVSIFLFSDGFEFSNMLLWIPYLYIAFRRLFPQENWLITLVKTYFIARIFSFITFGLYKKLIIAATLWLMH